MLELIEQKDAERIIELLECYILTQKIELEIGMFKLEVTNVSETNRTEHHQPYRMNEVYLLGEGNTDEVLNCKGKRYTAFINIGEWGYETRLKDTHITLGSNKFHDFCFQLELSQALEDEETIYVVKNISNMAGPGAICRLYRPASYCQQ